jgi:transposase
MARRYQKHGSAFKSKVALEAIKEQRSLGELCQEYSLSASQISTWKKQLEEGCKLIFESNQADKHQEEIDRLHRIIGQLTTERDFLERVLKH